MPGTATGSHPAEVTLDPPDWEEFRRQASRAVDTMVDYLRPVRERPVWQRVPADVEERLREGAPRASPGIRRRLRVFSPRHPAVSCRQRASAFLELGQRLRLRRRDAGGPAGRRTHSVSAADRGGSRRPCRGPSRTRRLRCPGTRHESGWPAGGLDETALAELNRRILVGLQCDGVAAPSSTRLNGQFAIPVCITNHRTRREDLELLVDATLRGGRQAK